MFSAWMVSLSVPRAATALVRGRLARRRRLQITSLAAASAAASGRPCSGLRISDCGGSGVHCSVGAGGALCGARYGQRALRRGRAGGASPWCPTALHARRTGGIWCESALPPSATASFVPTRGTALRQRRVLPGHREQHHRVEHRHCIALAVEAQVAFNIVASNARGISLAGGAVPALLCNCVHGNAVTDYSGLAPGTLEVLRPPAWERRPPAAGFPCIDAGRQLRSAGMDGSGRPGAASGGARGYRGG